MHSRTFTGNGYKFGFNGHESVDEVYGENNTYITEFRMLDVRLGRWWSVDPMNQFASPYLLSANNPVLRFDPDGAWSPESDDDGNVTLTAEEGDDFNTLVDYFGGSESDEAWTQAAQAWQGEWSNYSGEAVGENEAVPVGVSLNLTESIGGKYKLITDAINQPESGFFNCFSFSLDITQGREVDPKGELLYKEGQLKADNELQKKYNLTTVENAIVGETIIRYSKYNTKNSLPNHFAVYLGSDKSGNQYVATKNGGFPVKIQPANNLTIPATTGGIRLINYGIFQTYYTIKRDY
ncbi:MAG: hypothetical protein ACOCWG_05920, partial [bacterium]